MLVPLEKPSRDVLFGNDVRFDISSDMDRAFTRTRRQVMKLYEALKEVNKIAQELEREIPIGNKLIQQGTKEGFAEENRKKVESFNSYNQWYSKLDSMLSATTRWSASLMEDAKKM